MTLSPTKLLEKLVQHGNGGRASDAAANGAPDRATLDALEWSDRDTGSDLAERAARLTERA